MLQLLNRRRRGKHKKILTGKNIGVKINLRTPPGMGGVK